MALLPTKEIDYIRQNYVKEFGFSNELKAKFNAAIQAVEDILDSTSLKNSISTAINTATSPTVLTADQKRLLVRWVLKNKYDRGNQ